MYIDSGLATSQQLQALTLNGLDRELARVSVRGEESFDSLDSSDRGDGQNDDDNARSVESDSPIPEEIALPLSRVFI